MFVIFLRKRSHGTAPICALLSWQQGTRGCVPLAPCFWQVTAALLEDVLWGNCFDGE